MLISHGNADGWELYFHSVGVHIKAWLVQENSFQNSTFFAIQMAKFLCLANKLPHMCMHVYVCNQNTLLHILLICSTQKLNKIEKNIKKRPSKIVLNKSWERIHLWIHWSRSSSFLIVFVSKHTVAQFYNM